MSKYIMSKKFEKFILILIQMRHHQNSTQVNPKLEVKISNRVGGQEYAGTSKCEASSGPECWLDSTPEARTRWIEQSITPSLGFIKRACIEALPRLTSTNVLLP